MSLARVACRGGLALAAPAVTVEVHLGAGLPVFSIVGLPAAAVKESKERVRAALANAKFEFPAGRITVNLAPADLPKHGGRFDLAIAVAILIASAQLRAPQIERYELFGELGLDGDLRRVSGLLPAARSATDLGRALIVPLANSAELSWVAGARVYAAASLREVCAHCDGSAPLAEQSLSACESNRIQGTPVAAQLDLADVIGQSLAKQALLVAAAGGHSLLLVGPPGCGKSMLAQRLPGLLPALSDAEALDVATIASVASAGSQARALPDANYAPLSRPFRAPHHTASANAIIGGGARAEPGEVTLADRGVLFLDELPEFDRRVLEALREPLESGNVSLARVGLRAQYPARFQLVAAMNPCPCGYQGDRRRECRCTPPQIAQYRGRISGPLLDRIDLRVAMVSEMSPAESGPAGHSRPTVSSGAWRERVCAARSLQLRRGPRLNAQLEVRELAQAAALTPDAERLLLRLREKMALSLRAQHRLLRVARTVADLAASSVVDAPHIAEAQQLRRALESDNLR